MLALGSGNSATEPVGVMRPILSASSSANQRLPSGPTAIPSVWLVEDTTLNSVTVPVGVMRQTLPVPLVNHRLPSGAAAMSAGSPAMERGNSVIVPVRVMRPAPAV